MRDLQEDKASYLEAAALVRDCLEAMTTGISGIRFREDRLAAGLQGGDTQATDVAERLVSRGISFREAYRAVGKLVQVARASGRSLRDLGSAEVAAAEGLVIPEDLEALSPRRAQQAKEVLGGTGPLATRDQLDGLREAISGARARIQAAPRLTSLVLQLAR
jgi:argininosuccinate lyase